MILQRKKLEKKNQKKLEHPRTQRRISALQSNLFYLGLLCPYLGLPELVPVAPCDAAGAGGGLYDRGCGGGLYDRGCGGGL